MDNIIEFYEGRIIRGNTELIKIKKTYNIISLLRLLTIISLFFFMYLSYKIESFRYGILLFILHLLLFLYLTKIHEKIFVKKLKFKEFININENEIKRVNGEWKLFHDKGEEYLDLNHPFINDLDVFGKNSLFQWVNATKTSYGRKCLKTLLLFNKLPNKKEVISRQEALNELANKISFRQDFLIALKTKQVEKNESFLLEWINERNNNILSILTSIIRIGMPIVNLIIIILSIMNIITWKYIIISLGVSFFLLKFLGNEIIKGLTILEELKYRIKTYVDGIKFIEEEEFHSDKLNDIKSKFIVENKYASDSFKRLESITNWLYDRGNAFYIVFNMIFMWDYHIIYRLEKWRRYSGENVQVWLNSLGEFEALISLSSLIFNNPSWNTPVIDDNKTLKGNELSHPMLGEKGVSNSFIIDDRKRVLLITGSNMSGKSTFLRTIGFSVVLSYLGLNVKADQFTTPIFNIYTCMRTGDNLEENISSFYAEILRIKNIVDGTKRGEKIIFLLDEIFKGTNSLDRHLGAEILIKQLLKGETIGLVSTHDLELCDMEKSNLNITNYNFKEYYENNKLKFDYKLRKGISKTRNARYLMRMAGIDIT